MKRIILILVCCLFYNIVEAQSKAEDQFGAWYALTLTHKFNDKWSAGFTSDFRFYEVTSDLQQYMLRSNLRYTLSKKVSFALGHAAFGTDPSYDNPTPNYVNEQRLVADVNVTNVLGKLKLKHRYRYEHRFLRSQGENDTRGWFRYQLGVSYPLSDKWTADVYDEIFLNFEAPTFAQNWFGIGVSYQISKALKARLGYLKFTQEYPNFDRLKFGLVVNTNAIFSKK